MTRVQEIPLTFDCQGSTLVGILHKPARARERGVVIVVGGPQYRIGSHRQFLLLARDLSAQGFPVLRFDYRGLGDSEGEFVGFEGIEDDIRAAIDTLCAEVPEVNDVALWGLCDGATAIAFYAASDPRVNGLALVNPWVRSEDGLARARVRHYYWQRLWAGEFWRKTLRLKLDWLGSLHGLVRTFFVAFSQAGRLSGLKRKARLDYSKTGHAESLPERVGAAIRNYRGQVLLILSGQDLTAREFEISSLKSISMAGWEQRLEVTVKRLEPANHTYATGVWRDQVHKWAREWLERE